MAHPLLFGLIALVGIAALGLSAYWTHVVQHDPSDRFRSLIIFALFNSAWTVLFASAFVMWLLTGAVHFLASIGGSSIWLIITAVLWGVFSGMFHDIRNGDDCAGTAIISACRELLTLEALGWTLMGLCIITMLMGCCMAHTHRGYRRSYYTV